MMFQMTYFKRKALPLAASLALMGTIGNALAAPEDLLAYLDDYSVDLGGQLTVHVSIPQSAASPNDTYKITIFRVDGSQTGIPGLKYVTETTPKAGTHHADPTSQTSTLSWGTGDTITIDTSNPEWKSGVYKLKVLLGDPQPDDPETSFFTTFVVNPPTGSGKKILLLDNLLSVAGRTPYGGKSLAPGDANEGGEVNIIRPMGQSPELIEAASWLSKHYPGQFDVKSSFDLDATNILDGYDVVIIPGGSEFWTDKMKANYDAFIGGGGSAVILSAQTMFWKATLNGNLLSSNTADSADARYKTGTPENSSTGLSFRHGGFINDPLVPNDDGDFTALDHWAYKDSGISAGDKLGANITGPITDGAPVSFTSGAPTIIPGNSGTPANFQIMAWAQAHNEQVDQSNDGSRIGYGTPGVFKTSSGGWVFNAASFNWSNGLWDFEAGAEPQDPKISVVTKNIIDAFLDGKDVDNDGIPDKFDTDIGNTGGGDNGDSDNGSDNGSGSGDNGGSDNGGSDNSGSDNGGSDNGSGGGGGGALGFLTLMLMGPFGLRRKRKL